MRVRVPRGPGLPALLVSALLLAGTWLLAAMPVAAQSYGGGGGAPSPTPTTAPVAASSVQLGTRTTSLGTFLTGPNGMTLYTLSSDPNGGSGCTGQCLSFWPALTVAGGGTAHAPAGVGGTFGTFVRSDNGATQVTYQERALYYFANDTAPGQTNGEGIKGNGGVWHVAKVTAASSGSSGSGSGSAAGSNGSSGSTTGSTGSGSGSLPSTNTASVAAAPSPALPALALLIVAALIGTSGAGLALARRRTGRRD